MGLAQGFFPAHDHFALSSLHEAQCMAALEAMACGLPVVSTPIGGPAEAEQHVAGWNYDQGDAQALATVLLQAASQPSERLQRGRAARRLVKERFELSVVVHRLLDLYSSLTPLGEKQTR